MSIATTRDLEQARRNLETWLAGRLPDATGVEIGEVTMPPGAGFSNETLIADARSTDADGDVSKRLVIRVEPTAHTLYYEAPKRFHQQAEVLRTIGERTDLPVARIRFVEDDPSVLGSPFFAMDHVDGDTLPDLPPYNQEGWLHDATPEERTKLWWASIDALVAVHRIDWRDLGLDGLLEPQRGQPGMAQQLAYFGEFYDWAREGDSYPVIEHAGRWLADNLPADEPLALCWGDARLANFIYRDFEPIAVIDWDLVAIGDPLQDLGWWFLVDEVQFGDLHTADPDDPAALPGLPSRDETLEYWSEATGLSTEAIDYYVAFAAYRYAICAIRYVRLMNAAGMPPEAAQYADGMRQSAEAVLERIT